MTRRKTGMEALGGIVIVLRSDVTTILQILPATIPRLHADSRSRLPPWNLHTFAVEFAGC
jgi:hypothetical protein